MTDPPECQGCPSVEFAGADDIISTKHGLGAARTIEDFAASLQVSFSLREIQRAPTYSDDGASFTADTDGNTTFYLFIPLRIIWKFNLCCTVTFSGVLHHPGLLSKDDQRTKTMLAALLVVESYLAK